MHLATTPVTNGAAWLASKPLPRNLPAATPVGRLDSAPTYFAARVGHRNQVGTEQLELGIEDQGWITRGSFTEALAAASELAKALPAIWSNADTQPGTLGIVQGRDGWLLLRVGAGITDDRLSSPYVFAPATGKTPAVVRKTNDALLALVSPSRWIDLRKVAAT